MLNMGKKKELKKKLLDYRLRIKISRRKVYALLTVINNARRNARKKEV